jgi:hypothetical protein
MVNLLLAVLMAAGFVIAMRPFWTGLEIHEWLGLAVGAGVVAHMALHYRWIVGVTRKLLGRLPARTRIYYLIDASLLVAFLAIIGSGVAMSGAVLPQLGLQGSSSQIWLGVHKLSSMLTLVLLIVKPVLHRKWIANAVKRLLPARSRSLSHTRASQTPGGSAATESRPTL